MAGSTPLLFSSAGPVPTPPATLRQLLIALVATYAPGYTANLPASMIEDMTSTGTGLLVTADQSRVDAVNNVTPYGANPYILAQLGAMFGIRQGTSANANAYVVFRGSPGYVIPPGFIVSDGTALYAVQDGGTIGSGETSPSLYVVATTPSAGAIPANSISIVVTSVPSGYSLSVTNPLAGVPATSAESIEAYRSRIFQAYQVSIQGTPAYLKTLLYALPGVSSRLVAVQQAGSSWKVICGGGDAYQVAGAIFEGVGQIGLLTGSTVNSGRNVTVSIYDAPDTYSVVYVNPPQETVTVDVTWNTTLTGFTSGSAVNQYIIGAVAAYINSIVVGQPINLLVMTELIQQAIAPVLAPTNLTTLTFVVKINGTTESPTAGTSIIPPLDVEGYFYLSPTGATSTQG